MNRLRSRLLTLVFCLSHAPAYAGAEPVSTAIPRFFLGYYTETVALSLDAPKSLIAGLKRLCSSNGQLWAFGVGSPFFCKGFTKRSGVDEDFYEVKLKSSDSALDVEKLNPLLFSTSPIPEATWKSFTPTEAEATELKAAILKAGKKYGQAAKFVTQGKFEAFRLSDGRNLFIVPWKSVPTDFQDNESFSLALTKIGQKFKFSGVIEGSIRGYVDIDADQVPELLVSVNCDGRCEHLMTVVNGPERLFGISVH